MHVSHSCYLVRTNLRSKRSRVVSEQRKSEERDFRSFGLAKNERRAKKCKSPPLPHSFSFFLLWPHFSRQQNIENPFAWSIFARKPHGNACYTGLLVKMRSQCFIQRSWWTWNWTILTISNLVLIQQTFVLFAETFDSVSPSLLLLYYIHPLLYHTPYWKKKNWKQK